MERLVPVDSIVQLSIGGEDKILINQIYLNLSLTSLLSMVHEHETTEVLEVDEEAYVIGYDYLEDKACLHKTPNIPPNAQQILKPTPEKDLSPKPQPTTVP